MRLDHLLSKEHAHATPGECLGGMVVFTSGIVDERPSWLPLDVSTARPPCGVWVWNLVQVWWGWVVWHAVGCLRHQVVAPLGVVGWLFLPPSFLPGLVVLGGVLVGLLFEIWIVDASIMQQLATSRPLVVVVGGCVVCCKFCRALHSRTSLFLCVVWSLCEFL